VIVFESIVGIEVDSIAGVYKVGVNEVTGITMVEVNGEMAAVPWFQVETSFGKIMVNGKFVKQVFLSEAPDAYRLWVDGAGEVDNDE
jgi:hypothetical protein